MEEAFMQRTATCGGLRAADEGRTVILNGWVHRDRNHGALHFINLRDRYGLTQIVVDDDADEMGDDANDDANDDTFYGSYTPEADVKDDELLDE